jgi:hypothetical protein
VHSHRQPGDAFFAVSGEQNWIPRAGWALYVDRDPGSVLTSAQARRPLDFGEPIGLLMLFMAHCVRTKEDSWGLLKRYRCSVTPKCSINKISSG